MEKEYLKDPEFQPLILNYLILVEEYVEEAESLLAANEIEKVGKIGHNLKGTGSSYGFDDITELGRQLDEAGKMSQNEKIGEILIQIKTAVETSRKLFDQNK